MNDGRHVCRYRAGHDGACYPHINSESCPFCVRGTTFGGEFCYACDGSGVRSPSAAAPPSSASSASDRGEDAAHWRAQTNDRLGVVLRAVAQAPEIKEPTLVPLLLEAAERLTLPAPSEAETALNEAFHVVRDGLDPRDVEQCRASLEALDTIRAALAPRPASPSAPGGGDDANDPVPSVGVLLDGLDQLLREPCDVMDRSNARTTVQQLRRALSAPAPVEGEAWRLESIDEIAAVCKEAGAAGVEPLVAFAKGQAAALSDMRARYAHSLALSNETVAALIAERDRLRSSPPGEGTADTARLGPMTGEDDATDAARWRYCVNHAGWRRLDDEMWDEFVVPVLKGANLGSRGSRTDAIDAARKVGDVPRHAYRAARAALPESGEGRCE